MHFLQPYGTNNFHVSLDFLLKYLALRGEQGLYPKGLFATQVQALSVHCILLTVQEQKQPERQKEYLAPRQTVVTKFQGRQWYASEDF